jgi:hypothetical protein
MNKISSQVLQCEKHKKQSDEDKGRTIEQPLRY